MDSPFPERWKSEFALFIKAYGVARLAADLVVTETAVRHWIRGVSAPRRTHAEIIQHLARERGIALTLDAIYAHVGERLAGDPGLGVAIERHRQKAAEREAKKTARDAAVNVLAQRLIARRSLANGSVREEEIKPEAEVVPARAA